MALTTIVDHSAKPAPSPGLTLFSAGFRPFFLLSALWSALALPVWLCVYTGQVALPSALPPVVWHVHEMIYGYAAATVAGFLLTAIPNWTGRLPVRGAPLAMLAGLWLAGRAAVLFSGTLGATTAALADLAFPLAFGAVVARELIAGRNWKNLPMLVALALLFTGNLMVHLQIIGTASTAELGNRLGLATILMLIALVGGRIVPSFTRNWLAKARPKGRLPAPIGRFDLAALLVTGAGLAAWVIAPAGSATPWFALAAGLAAAARLSRWCGLATLREPMVFILHLGYGWLALGLLLLGFNGLHPLLPADHGPACADCRRDRDDDAGGDDPRHPRAQRAGTRRGARYAGHLCAGHPGRAASPGRAAGRGGRDEPDLGRGCGLERGFRTVRACLWRIALAT